MKAASNINRYFLGFLVVLLLSSQMAFATNYVTLNDGRLLVFPDSCVKSYSTRNGCLSFTAHDGSVYSYSLKDVSAVNKLLTKKLPSIQSYRFDNLYNYQVFTDAEGVICGTDITVEVRGIGKWLTASFSLSDEAARVYVNGLEQVSNQSRLHFDTTKVYIVGHPGDAILAPQPSGKYDLVPFGRLYTVNVDFLTDHSTATPFIEIYTVGGVDITSKKQYVDAEIIIDGAGVFPSMTDSVQIKGRGNSSWNNNDPNDKNPYRLKFAHKVKPFGMTKGKSWVLLANKRAGSMLTNAIGMKAASLLGTEAVNHIIPVDLYINGTYKGSYNFTEKVGLANNSVDLDDESVATLLELDSYYNEAANQKFRSDPFELPVNIKEPEFDEGTTLLTLDDIKNRFNAFATAVQNGENLSEYADFDILARYFLLNGFICNMELFHPKSTYCYYENVLDENSKLKFGPVWDLDWAFGYDGRNPSSYFKRNIRYDYFSTVTGKIQGDFASGINKNPQTQGYMYLLWKDFVANGLDELCDYCHEYYEFAKPSFLNNQVASRDSCDYSEQVDKAVEWLRQRAAFLLEKLKQKYEMPGDVNNDREVGIADVSALIDILLGGETDSETQWRADVNQDNEITLGDVNALIDLIIGN